MIGLVSIIYPPVNCNERRKNSPKEGRDRLLERYKKQMSKHKTTSAGEAMEKLHAK